MENKQKKVLVILGPTASGKTALAVSLARQFNGEIVSADSRQVYRGMDIGTGKDLEAYGEIRHHLINVADPQQQFSLAEYQRLAIDAIEDIISRGKLPIICGGTGLYISALMRGYRLPIAGQPSQEIRQELAGLSLDELLIRLAAIDPVTYGVIDTKNRRRVERALEIYYQTGVAKSAQPVPQPPAYTFLALGLTWPVSELRSRITVRLEQRLKQGMVAEIERLHGAGVSWQRLEEFGLEYRFIAQHLQDQLEYNEMVKKLALAIGQFAKRQMTWFKRDKNIIWLKENQQAQKLVADFLVERT